jgi:hypothetical protein
MATIVTIVTLLVTAYLLQGVLTTAQATTEELLTELDKPSEYLFSYKLQTKFFIFFVKNPVSECHVNDSALGTSIYLNQNRISFKKLGFENK